LAFFSLSLSLSSTFFEKKAHFSSRYFLIQNQLFPTNAFALSIVFPLLHAPRVTIDFNRDRQKKRDRIFVAPFSGVYFPQKKNFEYSAFEISSTISFVRYNVIQRRRNDSERGG